MPRIKDLLFCFSLANLCFFKQWNDLLDTKYLQPYYESMGAYPGSFLGLFVNVFGLGTILYALLCWSKTRQKKIFYYGFHALCLVIGIIAANGVRLALNDYRISLGYLSSLIGAAPTYTLLGTTLLLGLAFVLKRTETALHLFRAVFVVTSPLLLLNTTKGVYLATKARGKAPQEIAENFNSTPKKRLIWLVFDGLDYRVSFPKRPKALKLPHLDKLRKEAFFAKNAKQPAEETNKSIPSFLLGQKLRSGLALSPAQQIIITKSKHYPSFLWKPKDSLFGKLSDFGVQSGVVGWHIPYCSLMKQTVEVCVRLPHYNISRLPYRSGVFDSSKRFITELTTYGGKNAAARHIQNHTQILHHTQHWIEKTDLEFLFIHLPIPHNPIIFDAKTQVLRDDIVTTTEGHYDNLVLADKTLGKIRSWIAASPHAASTSLLVTSDHASRAIYLHDNYYEERVPFFFHFPEQAKGLEFTQSFEATMGHQLTLEFFQNKLHSPQEIADWLRNQQRRLSQTRPHQFSG